MSTWKRARAGALAVVLVGVRGVGVAQDQPKVVIRIYEDSTMSVNVMSRSRARVEAILHRAGVGVVWRACSSNGMAETLCNVAPDPDEVVVRLVSRLPLVSAHACGVALVPTSTAGHFITLFPRCVHESADALGVPADVVFACSLAHEIGHAFLGPRHGALGLMQVQPRMSDWTRGVHDGLLFTSAESARLRDALMLRTVRR